VFWNRGDVWRAVLLPVACLIVGYGAWLLVLEPFGGPIDPYNDVANVPTVALGRVLPEVGFALVIIGFVWSMGWFSRLFGRQPIGGRWWMWTAPVLLVCASLAVLATNDYTLYSTGTIVLIGVVSLLTGFYEETLMRGAVVLMLRAGRHSEWVVTLLSSLIFAVLHVANLVGSDDGRSVALTVAFAFPFGVGMYLTLRASGNLIWPILVHSLYDLAVFLATGWAGEPGNKTLELLSDGAVILVGVIGLIFVRGKVQLVAKPPALTSAAP